MKKLYERPDVAYISLIAEEAITNDILDGDTDLESSLGDDEWDD